MDIICDNASMCGGKYRDMGDEKVTREWARSRGWHIWQGTLQSGKPAQATLCPACVGAHRRKLPSALTVEGEQLELEL